LPTSSIQIGQIGAMAGTVTEVSSKAELQDLCASHKGLTTLLVWAPWHPPSVHLTKVLDAMAAKEEQVRFGKVNADVCSGLANSFSANQVPFTVFLNPRGEKIDTIPGADPPKLVDKVKQLSSMTFDAACAGSCSEASSGDLNSKLKQLINYSPVMLFIKGSKADPYCKFSKQAVAIMEKYNVEYSTFDILKDEEIRQGLKEYSNWPTYPQLYIKGELLGGVDILKEKDEDGSLKEDLPGEAAAETLDDRLKKLINKGQVTLFMKGMPSEPRCGFSRKICELLDQNSIKFEHFDILSDEEVRQGLKTYSNWPTYPQLYANGKLVGGLDIVKELADEGSLLDELGANGM